MKMAKLKMYQDLLRILLLQVVLWTQVCMCQVNLEANVFHPQPHFLQGEVCTWEHLLAYPEWKKRHSRKPHVKSNRLEKEAKVWYPKILTLRRLRKSRKQSHACCELLFCFNCVFYLVLKDVPQWARRPDQACAGSVSTLTEVHAFRGPTVEKLILQFGGLAVTVRSSGSAATASATTSHPREAPPPSSSSDFAVVSEPASARVPLAGPPAQLERWAFVFEITSPSGLAELDLGRHWDLARGLGADQRWSARARVGRAFRAGVGALAVVEGLHRYQPSSPPLPTLRNRYYVCVRCTRHPDGFITQSATTFVRLVAGPNRQRFEEFAISHAFPSWSEVGAFFAALDTEWPPVL